MKCSIPSLLGSLLMAAGLSYAIQAKADPVTVTVDTVPAGQAIVVDGTNYLAPAEFSWEPASPHTLVAPSPQTGPDGHTRQVFNAWSDGGAQTNQVVTPAGNTNYTATFSTQYLLETVVNPSGAGVITNEPAGPWYTSNQVVTLTAVTNAGYRVYYWSGVETGTTGRTATVRMFAPRIAQATFLPADFPYIVVTNNGTIAPGNLIGNIAGRTADKTSTYYVVLDSAGTNVVYADKTNTLLRFVTPQGFDAVGTTTNFSFKDETWTVADSAAMVGGYTLDTHDVKLLPNGHAFVFAKETRTFDMSAYGGKTNASVQGDVFQEVDANNRLVFEWHSFDHISITNSFSVLTNASFDYAHLNAMTIDPTDNNFLLCLRTTSEIIKVNRQTGEVMWHFGGKKNMFTILGDHAENAPYYTVGQHDVHRLANGHLLFFDNGNLQGVTTTQPDRGYSRAVEYALDEETMTATLVWEFRHSLNINAGCTGSVKRMPNGNTLIDWGCAVPNYGVIVTEVNSAGQVVMEMKHWTNSGIGSVLLGGGLTKQSWNGPDLLRSASFSGVQASRSYTAAVAGVTVTLNTLSAPTNNALVVQRSLDAVRLPQFAGKAPQVTMEHVVLSGANLTSLAATLELSLPDTNYVFDTPTIHDPTQMIVYGRPVPGNGQFTPLTTTYDAGARKVRVNTTSLGEFIFGYPDMLEMRSAPVLLSPTDGGQALYPPGGAATLTWAPQGFFGSFELQVATNADFSDDHLVLSTNGLGANSSAVAGLSTNTQYFWRVRAVGEGVPGDWATASFTAVPAFIQVTFPVGGEVWVRNQSVTLLWNDNISEDVAFDLYADGVLYRTLPVTANGGAYTWKVAQNAVLESTNYTLKIRSTLNPDIYGFSQPITIVNSNRVVTFSSVPAGLGVTVDGTNYITPKVLNLLPLSSHTLEIASPQTNTDGHSRYLFSSWSDSGGQNHSYSVPLSPRVTNTATFTTNYLLDVAAAPPEAGGIVPNPAGPWYEVGQVISLTANTNAGYLFYDWQGVDSKAQNTAQVAMSGYRSVQAKFIPVSGIPRLNGSSLVQLGDGRMQFSFTAGAGAATQATVWATPSLSPANWQFAGTVPLSGGNGVFTEAAPNTNGIRFFRVTLP